MNNETRQKFLKQIEAVEGRKHKMYMLDNIPHIGIGHNIISRPLKDETLAELNIEDESDLMTAELTDAQCEYLFFKDLDIAFNDARNAINTRPDGTLTYLFEELTEERQEVLVDMSFNLGGPRFRGFKNMIRAVQNKNYDDAAAEILDSKAARDPKTAKRYADLANRMLGEFTKFANPEPEKHITDARALIAQMRDTLTKLEATIDDD